MRQLRSLWPAVLGLSSIVIALMMYNDLGGPARVAFTLWYFLVCPGMAFAPLIRLSDPLGELTVGIALSLATETIVGAVLVYSGHWSVDLALTLLIGLTTVGAILQVILVNLRPSTSREAS